MAAAPCVPLEQCYSPSQKFVLKRFHVPQRFYRPPTRPRTAFQVCCLRQSDTKEEKEGGRGRLIQQEGPIETSLVKALRSIQVQPSFREIVSTTKDWGQTLTHASISYGHPSLLSSLVD